MNKQPIRDFYNRIIGYVETLDNGDQVARDFYNRIVGYWYKRDNTTRNFYKQIIGRGNFVTQLIFEENEKNK